MGVSIQDSPTDRKRFHQLTYAEQEALLEGIRERRLEALRTYQLLQDRKKEARDQKLAVKAGKLADRMNKKADAIEKGMQELEAMVKEVRSVMILLAGEAA